MTVQFESTKKSEMAIQVELHQAGSTPSARATYAQHAGSSSIQSNASEKSCVAAFCDRVKDLLSQLWRKFCSICRSVLRFCCCIAPDYFRLTGNVDTLDEADVICFAIDDPSDKQLQKKIDERIAELHRESDVILLQGRKVSQSGSPWLTQCEAKGSLIVGCEPENYEQLLGTPEGYDENLNQLETLFKPIFNLLSNGLPSTAEEIAQMDEALKVFVSEHKRLAEYFDPETTYRLENLFGKGFSHFKQTVLDAAHDPIQLFKALILTALDPLEKNQMEARDRHMTPENYQQLYAGIPVRNAFLCQEIDKWRAQGKRVIVLAASGCLYAHSKIPPQSVDQVDAMLNRHRCVIAEKREG
jgi:hypothetical protein